MKPSVRRTLIGVAVTLPVISSSRRRRLERIVDARLISVGSILLTAPAEPREETGLLGCGFEGRDEGGVGSGTTIGLEEGGPPFTDEAFILRAFEDDGLGRVSSTP